MPTRESFESNKWLKPVAHRILHPSLWRMNRRRLEFEATRDALLAVAGSLDLTLGGRSIDLAAQPYRTRRTVYGLVDRQDLADMFRVFDFASPDSSTELRTRTTVPQQALFVMNSPLVIEQAKRLASRADIASHSDAASRVQALYRAVLARAADRGEVEPAAAGCRPKRSRSPRTRSYHWSRSSQVWPDRSFDR